MHKNRNITLDHYQPGKAAKPVFMVTMPAMRVNRPALLAGWHYMVLAGMAGASCGAVVGMIVSLFIH